VVGEGEEENGADGEVEVMVQVDTCGREGQVMAESGVGEG
jgi:hypothetical protein